MPMKGPIKGPIKVTVWGENRHEQREEEVRRRYPDGMHGAIAAGLTEHLGSRVRVRTAVLDDPEHGLSDKELAETDVLTWWGHMAHEDVADEVVERVRSRVLGGMGLLVLHSGHYSKLFRSLMGTTCTLNWRDAGERELVWTVAPGHPIAEGVPRPIVIGEHETYGEPFGVPEPDELVFISSFGGGEAFRSGCCYRRGLGRIFYFSPGDQNYPVYHHPDVRRVLANAVLWAAPPAGVGEPLDNAHTPVRW
ncbi:ThuA domain-containing protein [Nonomuraea harbinensis]|uniref:ThuA domain-containing protein n=1 Tax=Nonomuraea harbinensis TaxID=1286938 RepID=A0ABW1BT33_9ACTN|nr:ThuA domain-containing protein [Nonomuraea harbinensis]